MDDIVEVLPAAAEDCFVFFPGTNTWRTWSGLPRETVEVLASEFGAHEFRTKEQHDENNAISVGG